LALGSSPAPLRSTSFLLRGLPRARLTYEQHALTSFDGTNLAYYTVGKPEDRKPVMVLANGLGGTHTAWRHQIGFLRERYRFLTWDYRGLFSSSRPRDPSPSTWTSRSATCSRCSTPSR